METTTMGYIIIVSMFFPFSPYKPNIILRYTLLLEQSGVGVVYKQGRAALNAEGRYRLYRSYIGIMEEKWKLLLVYGLGIRCGSEILLFPHTFSSTASRRQVYIPKGRTSTYTPKIL